MTFEELRNAGFVEHHRCGACNSPVGYEIHPDYASAVFQSGCDCSGTYPNWRTLTHKELAAILTKSKDAQTDVKQEAET
jgi:hypothetical protein